MSLAATSRLPPHCDKSGLPILLHFDRDGFVIAPPSSYPLFADLSEPEMCSAHRYAGILFPGMYLAEAGFVNLMPSPHTVLAKRNAIDIPSWAYG